VQVFDTLTEQVWAQKKYADMKIIKGLSTIGKDVFGLRHVIVDESDKMIVDVISQ
jgi:hypothetical protein